MDSQVEEVKGKSDIVSIIGEHVTLKKAGTNYKGLCPFHSEKTPSFMVSSELQIYKCFGCGEGGDVFSFLQKYEGMEFGEALKFLADRAGITLKRTREVASDKDVLYELNALSAKFYNYLLTKHEAGKEGLAYLSQKRKIGKVAIDAFNIGFAPIKPMALVDFLRKKKFKEADIERAGLAYRGRSGLVDRFRGRIIFPISDHRGQIIALAGRILPAYDDKRSGKYINSPETPIYHKSFNLYGLNVTRSDIKKAGFAVVVEGELDLISSWIAGVRNVVAIKGSALTGDQARILGRFTKEIVLALDSDFAGGEASRRGISILEEEGFSIKVARLGKFKDPDEAAQNDPEFYKNAIKKAVPIWDFVIDLIFAKEKDKTKLSRELAAVLATIGNEIVQAQYINLVAGKLRVPPEAVSAEVEKRAIDRKPPQVVTANAPQAQKTRRLILEEKLVSLIFQKDPSALLNSQVRDLIKDALLIKIIDQVGNFLAKNEKFDLKAFNKTLPKELSGGISRIVFGEVEDDYHLDREIKATYKELFNLDVKAKLVKIVEQIALGDDKNDSEKSLKLKSEYEKLSRLRYDFKDLDLKGIIQESQAR